MSVRLRKVQPFLAAPLTLLALLSAPSALAQETVSIYANVGSQEVGPPPPNWFWYDAVEEALGIDVNISWSTDSSQYGPKLNVLAASNSLPDLFLTDLPTLQQLVAQGLAADWTPYLEQMPTFVEDRNVLELAPLGTMEGGLYGLMTKNAFPYKTVTVIRQDWLDKLGLEVPKTLDEYFSVMEAFTTQDPDGNGRNDTFGFSGAAGDTGALGGFEPIWGAFGSLGSGLASWEFVDDKLVAHVADASRLDALEFINQMNQAGVIDPDWSVQKGLDFQTKWLSGKIGIFSFDWCATFCRQGYEDFAAANPTGVLRIIDPPVGPDGESAAGVYSQAGQMYVMSQKAVDEGRGEAVARLLEWINTDGYYLTAFGQEGVHWERNAEGQIVPGPEPYLDSQNLVFTQLRPYAYKGSEEELRARYDNTFEAPNGETISVWSILERAAELPKTDITDEAILPPASPAFSADLERTINEAQLQFVLEQRPFSDWENYVATLDGIGLEQWRAEAQQVMQEAGPLE
jgi:putative aldouronate transport system substrate-binding protein